MPPPASNGLSDRHLALVAVLAGIMWSIGAIDLSAPSVERMGLLLVGVALGVAGALGRGIGLGAGLYAVAVGGVERLQRDLLEQGSDVLRATAEAIDVLMNGRNPYDHVMLSTEPIGSPFVYPPGEFLFYLLPYRGGIEIGRIETWAGIVTIAVLVVAGARVGTGRAALVAMLYAVWGIAAFRTTDGGNDVAAALLVVVGFVALAFTSLPHPRGRIAFAVSAVALGWALAFKQLALLIWPFALRHLATTGAPWRRYLAISGGVAAGLTLPFLLWSPGAFLSQQLQALTFHDRVWGANLLNTLAQWWPVDDIVGAFFALELLGTAGLVVL
ncbi:MAG: hypothetical protein HYU87_12140, partial [Chloroflexi bacterium]|nr:hypothetical protein [Chloroflexota bacterium]